MQPPSKRASSTFSIADPMAVVVMACLTVSKREKCFAMPSTSCGKVMKSDHDMLRLLWREIRALVIAGKVKWW